MCARKTPSQVCLLLYPVPKVPQEVARHGTARVVPSVRFEYLGRTSNLISSLGGLGSGFSSASCESVLATTNGNGTGREKMIESFSACYKHLTFVREHRGPEQHRTILVSAVTFGMYIRGEPLKG